MARAGNLKGIAARQEIFFEIIPLGRWVRVVALNADTGKEVQVQGPNNPASITYLKQMAIKKLGKK